MTVPSNVYADEERFKAEAHKHLNNMLQSSEYDPLLVSKLVSLEEQALKQVLSNLKPEERELFLKALDEAADKDVMKRVLSNAADAIGIGFKNVKANNSHLIDLILFGGSVGILPLAYLHALSDDMPWIAKIPYMAVMLPVAAAIVVAEAIIAAAVFIAVSPALTAWSFIAGVRTHYDAQNSAIGESYQSLKDKIHKALDENSQTSAPQEKNSPQFLGSLINYLAAQPGSNPGNTHRFFSVSKEDGDKAREDIDDMRPWNENEKFRLY